MINVKTIPFRNGARSAVWSDPVLTVDSVDYDLSLLNDGDTAKTPTDLREVTRNGSNYNIKLAVAFDPSDAIRTTIDPFEINLSNDGVIL